MRNLINLLLSCLIIVGNSFGQEIEWQNTIGGSDIDYLVCISPTADGGCLCGGYSRSGISGDKTESNRDINGTFFDYWVLKLDSVGNIQWQKTLGGSSNDDLYSVSSTADGGCICAGSSASNISGDKTENCIGSTDYWVVKLNSMGAVEWQNTIGGTGADVLTSVKQTSDGGYIGGGYSRSGISGDKTEDSLGLNDYWIVKLDTIGNIQWQNTIGGNNEDYLFSISQTIDGGYICGGYSKSGISGDKIESSWGQEDYWIIKLDSIGNIQWQNTIGAMGSDILNSVCITDDGGYVCGGYSNSQANGDKTENSSGQDDLWIVKLDSTGIIQWQNTVGGNHYDQMISIAQTSQGKYTCAGLSNSNISGDKSENNIWGNDFWIVTLDSAGKVVWDNTIGGVLEDRAYSVSATTDGKIICGGFSNSTISVDKTENCWNNSYDYWILKLTNKFNTIGGKLFIDVNSNTVQDSNETTLNSKMVKEQITGRVAFTNQAGFYSLSVLDTGSFSVAPSLSINYYNAFPVAHNVVFTSIMQTDSLNDFAFQPAGVFNDLCVTLTPLGNFRSGFSAAYMINYQNVGTTTLNPGVVFFPDSNINFISANPAANNIYPDSVIWNLPSIAPFQSGNIFITVHVNAGIPIGTLINSTVRIDPVINDANTTCNYAGWETHTTGSNDPNAILVSDNTLTTAQISSPPFLDYIIYFQNTGNDTAFSVKVLNPIDTNFLDLSSFEFIDSSHPVNLKWINYQRNMEFKFDNILLPDSNINEPASHGFARYRIKPKTNLIAGDSISNFAAIYFDFNAPVLTNTALTAIILPTGLNQVTTSENLISVYPNPVNDELTVSYKGLKEEKVDLKIFDLSGRIIYLETFTTSITTLKTGNLTSGIYFLEISNRKHTLRTKFVKQ